MPADEKRSDRELAELAALADGSLPPERRAALERRVAESPRLQALLREQREAIAAVRALDDRAPERVKAPIEGARERQPARRRRVRRRIAIGATVAAGLAAPALLVLLASEQAPPTLAETAELAAKSPTTQVGPGPVEAWGVEYPDLTAERGWHMTGARTDDLGPRTARTVFYTRDERRIAYTIVSAGSVRTEGATRSWRRKGKPWYAFEQDGRTVVAWERDGKMCVVSADGLDSHPLVELITSG